MYCFYVFKNAVHAERFVRGLGEFVERDLGLVREVAQER